MELLSTLLVVEDNPAQQIVARALAERYGYAAYFVSTGEDAIEVFKTSEIAFDAILMDLNMPRMSGLECTRRIRELEAATSKRVPIVGFSAYTSDEGRQTCINAGMDDYLSKPFEIDEFRRMLLKWTYNAAKPNLRILPQRNSDIASA